MKKIFLPFVIASTLLVSIIVPQQGLAQTNLQQATNELKEALARQKQAEKNLQNAQSKIRSIQAQKKQTANDVNVLEKNITSLNHVINSLGLDIASINDDISSLDHEINSFQLEIDSLEKQIENTNKELKSLENKSKQVEADLAESERLLQETKERVEARELVLRERLRHMYTSGSVSYLEVLLSSTSFTDFLDRFQNLKTIANLDKEILESNKRDYELITVKITEIEEQKAQLALLYEQQVAVKDQQVIAMNNQIAAQDSLIAAKDRQLAAKNQQVTAKNIQVSAQNQLLALKKNKEVQIAILHQEEQQLAHYTKQQEKEMLKAAAIVANSKKSIEYYEGGKLAYPLIKTYRVSSNFGRRIDPISGRAGAMHNGIDFAAPAGTSILAAESGRVLTAGWVGGYGNTVIIDHGNGLWTLYAHARKGGIKVKVGDTVKKGQKISEVGTTGNSTGNHLHFEVRLNQKALDPRDYLVL